MIRIMYTCILALCIRMYTSLYHSVHIDSLDYQRLNFIVVLIIFFSIPSIHCYINHNNNTNDDNNNDYIILNAMYKKKSSQMESIKYD